MNDQIWAPTRSRIENAQSTAFQSTLDHPISGGSFHDLYEWSIKNPETFWQKAWGVFSLTNAHSGPTVCENRETIEGARWFPEASLNFAENLLQGDDDKTALIWRDETGLREKLSYGELRNKVQMLRGALLELGLKPGDVVAAVVPNTPHAVIAMLAVSSIGAVWSSCSPDFGTPALRDRFEQIRPILLLFCCEYRYRGRKYQHSEKLKELLAALPTLQHVITFSTLSNDPTPFEPPKGSLLFDGLLQKSSRFSEFVLFPFNHPLYILFSSGTTGLPKAIIHGAGGTLLEHLKEHRLHLDLTPLDTFFYVTTCGWMMWNWLASGLASRSTLVLYDGHPLADEGTALWKILEEEQVTIFGASPAFLQATHQHGLKPLHQFGIGSLHTLLSTGSPLLPEQYDFVYEHIKNDICLSSISGGTDILGCFALGSPTLPVYRGELQTRSLALEVDVVSEEGLPLKAQKGELVCRSPFPSCPLGFVNDPDRSLFRKSYFTKFPGIWAHGDYVELTEHGGLIIYGRSDAVLNPGGIRIGTAEIYRPLQEISEIEGAVVVGQPWQGDIRVILFVQLSTGTLTDALQNDIRSVIRERASARHVPDLIFQVKQIPITRSGKIMEVLVQKIFSEGKTPPLDAVANPESISEYEAIALQLRATRNETS